MSNVVVEGEIVRLYNVKNYDGVNVTAVVISVSRESGKKLRMDMVDIHQDTDE